LSGAAAELASAFDDRMVAFDLTGAMAALDGFVREANRYLVERAPWSLAKDPDRRQVLSDVLYEALEALRHIAIFASPVMPGAAARLWEQLGIAESLDSQRLPDAAAWGLLEPGTKTAKGDSLFPRLDE
jgi:methionyl-tRNA synthetase